MQRWGNQDSLDGESDRGYAYTTEKDHPSDHGGWEIEDVFDNGEMVSAGHKKMIAKSY